MSIGNIDAGVPKFITATTQVTFNQGALKSIFVSSATTATITVYDSGSGSTANKIVDTFTPVAPNSYSFNYAIYGGVYIVLTGTISCTVSAV